MGNSVAEHIRKTEKEVGDEERVKITAVRQQERDGETEGRQHTSRAMLLNASSSAEKRSLMGARFLPGVPMSSPAPAATLQCSQGKEWSTFAVL